MGDSSVWVVYGGGLLQIPPAAAFFTGAVAAAAEDQTAFVATEGQPRFRFIPVQSGKDWGVFQGDGVGALLIELEKIAAMFVEKGKMGGNNDGIGGDGAVVCNGGILFQFPNRGVFEDSQIPDNGGEKF